MGCLKVVGYGESRCLSFRTIYVFDSFYNDYIFCRFLRLIVSDWAGPKTCLIFPTDSILCVYPHNTVYHWYIEASFHLLIRTIPVRQLSTKVVKCEDTGLAPLNPISLRTR